MIKRTGNSKKVVLKLIGLDGNAFNVLGHFRRAAIRAGWSAEEIKAVLDDATSGDYNHLLATIAGHVEEPREDE